MKTTSTPDGEGRPTVEQIQREAHGSRQRFILLADLIRELEVRWGRLADDPDFLCFDGSYELPRRDVVQQLRGDLVLAQARAHSRYRQLSGAAVDVEEPDDDEELLFE